MRISLIYGRFSGGGPFDIQTLFRSKGLTGSESSFFNAACGLADLGHQVQVFCDAAQAMPDADMLGGADVWRLEQSDLLWRDSDAVLAWNEPDMLRLVPASTYRLCFQQLNDFDYCYAGYDAFVDGYVFPSARHLEFMAGKYGLDLRKCHVIPNSVNLEFYKGTEEKRPRSVAYCSSPDRGLHWLLEFWPAIRREVPDAQLRVYYKVDPWLRSVRDLWFDQGLHQWYEIGFRARYVEECFKRLGREGENGVHLIGPTPNIEMARELMRTEVLAYPCDTVRWTEGFSVAIMDACAAGCAPIVSDVDALGQIYGGATHVIADRPRSQDSRWIGTIVHALTDAPFRHEIAVRAQSFAARHARQVVVARIEKLIRARASS